MFRHVGCVVGTRGYVSHPQSVFYFPDFSGAKWFLLELGFGAEE